MYSIVRSVLLVVLAIVVTPHLTLAQSESDAALPAAPQITSPTYPEPARWYQRADAEFAWVLPESITAVAVGVGESTEFEPMTPIRPPEDSYTFPATAFAHGEQYVGVQFRNNEGWGDISYYPVRIDSIPPEVFTIETVRDEVAGVPALVFSASDTASGISGYLLSINGGRATFLTPSDVADGYTFAGLPPGSYTIEITALDRAGNAVTERFPIYVVETSEASNVTGPSMSGLAIFLLGGFFVGALLVVFIVYRRSRRREAQLREEFMEVHVQLEKIFTALRDEIEIQVNELHRKKRLTKAEKRVVENLQNVLAVSRTLVAKEMKDVRKLLRKKR